jgi:catechol 2,3-dioxygenase-like lactoylglutathione lyase family enzyme
VIRGLGHVDLVCDLERSLAFYAAALGPLGRREPVLFKGERGESIHDLRFPAAGSGSIGLSVRVRSSFSGFQRPGRVSPSP